MVWLRWDNRFGGEERRAGQDCCAITAVLLSQFQNKQVIFRVFLTEFCSLWSRHRLMAHDMRLRIKAVFGACFLPPGCLYRGLFGNFGLSCPCVVRHAKTDIEMIDDDRTPSNPLRESLGSSWFSCHFCDVLWIGNEANTTFHHIDLPRIVVPGEAGWYFARSWSCRWCRCFVSKCLFFFYNQHLHWKTNCMEKRTP